MNNMSKNWKSILVYILIPILLIGAVIYFVNSQTSTQLKYSQVVSMFKITRFPSSVLIYQAVILFIKPLLSRRRKRTTLFRMFHISLMISGKVLINIMTSIAISRLFMTIGQERQMLGFTV